MVQQQISVSEWFGSTLKSLSKSCFSRTNRGSFLFALVAGAIYPLGFAPLSFWPFTLLSIALLYVLLQQQSKIIRIGLGYGLGFFGVGTSWVYVSIHEFGHASVLLAFFLTVLFSLYLSLYPLLMVWLYRRLKTPVYSLLSISAFCWLWLFTDLLRGWIFSGFPWLYAGYSFIDSWLVCWAPLVGVHGITLLSLISAICAVMLMGRHRSRNTKIIAMISLVIFWGGGALLKQVSWSEAEGEAINVTLVQPNIDQDIKWSADFLWKTLDLLENQTRKAQPGLVIWPESAIPAYEHHLQSALSKIANAAALRHQTIITGIPVANSQRTRSFSAVSVLSAKKDKQNQHYYKRRLVPFGEYVPLQNWLRGVIEFFDLPMSDFSLGEQEQPSLDLGNVKLGVAICYEIVYPELVHQQALQSNILLTISNDAWFGASLGPFQHYEMARFRSLESGLPVIRGTNNGITAFTNAKGDTVKQLPQFQLANLFAQVQPMKSHAPILKYHAPGLLLGIIAVIYALLLLWKKKLMLKKP